MKKLTLALLAVMWIAAAATGYQKPPAQSGESKRYSPEGCGLSLELGAQPQKMDLPLPEDVSRNIYYLHGYSSIGKGFGVLITHVSAPTLLNPKILAEGVVKGIIINAQITDFSYSTEPSTETQAPLKGSYKQNGVALEFNGIALSQGKQAWVVATIYKQADKASQSMSERVLSSVKVGGPPCPEQEEKIGKQLGSAATVTTGE
ncbi:MAG TPA: hypothetical protein VJ464_24455 [Blastocatellia bacterium]|nr:hypothetical protein [Blastocatellia bacterium]